MWIMVIVLLSTFHFQQIEAQTTVSGTQDDDITLQCALTGGSFTLPEWRGPPSLLIYTNQDDASETINPAAPASNRLQVAGNKKDLILSKAQLNDSGVYKCSYTSLGEYTVTLTVTTAEHCKCECDCECRTIVIISMVFGILGALSILIVLVGLLKGCFDEMTTLLVPGVIGIVSDLISLISLILSIVGLLKDCCGASENCEDSECCEEDSECCEDWIDNAAKAFIAIPCVALVASVVIFILVKLDKIGPGCNAYKAKEAKEPGENHGMTGTSM